MSAAWRAPHEPASLSGTVPVRALDVWSTRDSDHTPMTRIPEQRLDSPLDEKIEDLIDKRGGDLRVVQSHVHHHPFLRTLVVGRILISQCADRSRKGTLVRWRTAAHMLPKRIVALWRIREVDEHLRGAPGYVGSHVRHRNEAQQPRHEHLLIGK